MVKKNEFIDMIQESLAEDYTFTKKEIAAVVEAVSENILKVVRTEGESVKLGDLGTFSSKFVAAHEARNPATGGTVTVPDKTVPVFKFSATAKRTEG